MVYDPPSRNDLIGGFLPIRQLPAFRLVGRTRSVMTDWITTEEAREITGYSLAHLRDLLRQKKIVAEKRGGHYWIDRASILEYAQQAKSAGQSDKRHGAKGKRTLDKPSNPR